MGAHPCIVSRAAHLLVYWRAVVPGRDSRRSSGWLHDLVYFREPQWPFHAAARDTSSEASRCASVLASIHPFGRGLFIRSPTLSTSMRGSTEISCLEGSRHIPVSAAATQHAIPLANASDCYGPTRRLICQAKTVPCGDAGSRRCLHSTALACSSWLSSRLASPLSLAELLLCLFTFYEGDS